MRLGRASGCSNTPHWTRNDVLDLQSAMSMKTSVEDGKVCNCTTMEERPKRIEVWIVDETDCFRFGYYREDGEKI